MLQVSIDVVNHKCLSFKIVKELGFFDCKLMDVRSIDKGITRHLIKFNFNERNKLSKKISTEIHTNGNHFWFDSDGCDLCNTIISHDSFLINAKKIKEDIILYSFLTPSFSSFQNIIMNLEEKGFNTKVIKATRFSSKDILTDRQEKVFWLALKMGFFDFSRKINSARARS